MRLSVACVATDAEYQNRIIQRDRTLNLPVVARQPHPDPNHAPYYAVHQASGPRRGASRAPTGRLEGAYRAPAGCSVLGVQRPAPANGSDVRAESRNESMCLNLLRLSATPISHAPRPTPGLAYS